MASEKEKQRKKELFIRHILTDLDRKTKHNKRSIEKIAGSYGGRDVGGFFKEALHKMKPNSNK